MSRRTVTVIIIVLLAMTPRSEMHPASYVFGSDGIINQTGGWNTGLSFLFGLLSVQWTVSVPAHLGAYSFAAVLSSRMIGTSARGLMRDVPGRGCGRVQQVARAVRSACLCIRLGTVLGRHDGTCPGPHCLSDATLRRPSFWRGWPCDRCIWLVNQMPRRRGVFRFTGVRQTYRPTPPSGQLGRR